MRFRMRVSWSSHGFPMRVSKRSAYFNLWVELSFVPSWIGFEDVPIHLFNKGILFSTARTIGQHFKLVEATTNMTRPSVARVCVELDLLTPFPQRIWIGIGSNRGFWQNVLYEDLPSYCSHYLRLGHAAKNCKRMEYNHKEENKQLLSSPVGTETFVLF